MKRRHQSLLGLLVMAGPIMGGGIVAAAPAAAAQAATVTGQVSTNRVPLNLRSGPTTTAARAGTIADGSQVTIVCQQPGQQIRGDVRSTNMWNRLSNGAYVSDAFVRRSVTPPRCDQTGGTGGNSAANSSGQIYTRGSLLNVRAGATTASAVKSTLRDGSRITIACQQPGQSVRGNVRTTNMWNRLTNGQYVADAFVKRTVTPQRCDLPVVAPKPTPTPTPKPTPTPTPTPKPTPPPPPATGKVDSDGVQLNVRYGPSTNAAVTATLPDGSTITISCQQAGEQISGNVRSTNMWNRLANGTYVSDAFVVRTVVPPRCAPLPASLAGWVAPVPAPGGSGYRTKDRPTHDGIDFSTYRNTPIVAAAAGTVIVVVCNSSTYNCDKDGSPSVYGCGWYVEIQHANRVVTRYCHMVRRPPVRVGQWVNAGQLIGNVGSSGNSSGPHLHFEVHTGAAPATRANATNPRTFLSARGVYF
ncbi:peptidoglycan DD-metalloendopeptidase family protein [Micromonospora sp. NPDC049679]|uniref:peptidoglycan DD-metalloendopeptidase family protein n=1 Tax=Micromonospora sp. NPDC049679 TaxID=3155920 RepID=UPI0033F2791B